jgi:hypothetical protein
MTIRKIGKIAFYACAGVSLSLIFFAVGSMPDERSAKIGWIGWALSVASLVLAVIFRPWK